MPNGTTWSSELKDGAMRSFELTPEAAGLSRSKPDDLKGGDAAHNAEALRAVLDGKPSAFGDAALMTTAAALIVAGKETDFKKATSHARDSVKSGAAKKALAKLIEVSNS